MDLEGVGLRDNDVKEWELHMDAQLEKRPVKKKKKRLVASTLNFSRNSIGDAGALQIVDYLQTRNISVQILKFSRNDIGDEGVFAVGQFISRSREPAREVYLSHNCISERGACSIMESIARSQKYPYTAGSGKRDPAGHSPVWLRLEHNCINWSIIEHRLGQARIHWCASDCHEGWASKDRAPMMCLHNTYMNQDGEIHEVPMYIFLDASALRQMLLQEDRFFCFKSLLNLCRQGNMKCNPAQGSEHDADEENDRIVFALTDSVLDELEESVEKDPEEQKRVQWFRSSQESYLELGHGLGILEALETCGHKRLMKLLPRHEQSAAELQISERAVKLFDFACLWASQIASDGRVLLVTGDAALSQFGAIMASDSEWQASSNGIPLVVLQIEELEKVFASEDVCQTLHAAASSSSAPSCDSPLSASLLTAVVDIPARLRGFNGHRDTAALEARPRSNTGSDVDILRREMRMAVSLFKTTQELLGDAEASSLVGRLDSAQKRWQTLLDSTDRGAPVPKQSVAWQ